MNRLSLIVPGSLILASLCAAQPATKFVFLVAIDGLRYTEGFGAGDTYMPCIWDSLRPQGTIYTNFLNTGITITNSGHSTIVTGVRQLLMNNLYISDAIRPIDPTIGECYRKDAGLPADKAIFVSGKSTIWRVPVSLHPGYGPEVAPRIVLPPDDDDATWDSASAVMDAYHPSLCYVLFAHVDVAGHTGDSVNYFSSISHADQLVLRLWKKIQSDSLYANRTTMIVTSDHGRHDNLHGGWQDHGDYCRGCRHIIFLAIGPDIKRNTVVTTLRDQIDIAPTVGALLNFTTPFAQGRVLDEMLTFPVARKSISRSASLASNGNGLHEVYSDNAHGAREVLYRRSTDRGASWSPSVTLYRDSAGEVCETAIAPLGENGLFAVSAGYTYAPRDSTYAWIYRGRRSLDGGTTWDPAIVLDSMANVSSKPAVSSSAQRVNATWEAFWYLKNYASADGGKSFREEFTALWGYPAAPSCITLDTTCYTAWHNLSNSVPDWNIWFDHTPWGQNTQLTFNSDEAYSYAPSICADSTRVLHTAFASIGDVSSASNWQVMHRKSTDLGASWSPPAAIPGSEGAFQPVMRCSRGNTLIAVWASCPGNQWSIRCSCSGDGGDTWHGPSTIASSPSLVTEPDFTTGGDTLFVIWRDTAGISFRQFVLTPTGGAHTAPAVNAFALQQNFPNPFNPTTHIAYSLAASGMTTLDVYNVLGQKVLTLVNERQSAGNYRATVDGSRLSSGCYFYMLRSGQFSAARTMTLVR